MLTGDRSKSVVEIQKKVFKIILKEKVFFFFRGYLKKELKLFTVKTVF